MSKSMKAAKGCANGGIVGGTKGAQQTAQAHVSSPSQNAMKRAVGGGGMPAGAYSQSTAKTEYRK